MKTKDVILLILMSSLGLRWIIPAGAIGTSSILFWVLGGLLFLAPVTIICIDFSAHHSESGGMYLWIKKTLGSKVGFIASWSYWCNNLFFYPAILTLMAINIAYALHRPDLASNKHYILFVVLLAFWSCILYNSRGIKQVSKIINVASLINFASFVFVIIGGVLYYAKSGHSETSFTLNNFAINNSIQKNIANLALLMFALSGIELIPTIAKSLPNPKKQLPKALAVSGVILILAYIIASLCVNLIISPQNLANSSGIALVFEIITHKLNLDIFYSPIMILLAFIEFVAVILWLIGPTIMLFEEKTPHSRITPIFYKMNKNNVPLNAMILQGVIVTVMMIASTCLPSVSDIYNLLIFMLTIVYFIPFLFMIVGYIKASNSSYFERPLFNKHISILIGIISFIAVSFGILVSFVPPDNLISLNQVIVYELELFCGPLVVILSALLLYKNPLSHLRKIK